MAKLLKDPVHGYIEVEEEFIALIDTAMFQRLKRLEQTSYRVLYPGASHDRFIHSLGVFHLGKQAFESIMDNLSGDLYDYKNYIEELRLPFLLACLMHDVGHAPFSHSLEKFYPTDINDSLKNALRSIIQTSVGRHEMTNKLERDFDLSRQGFSPPSPHEVMSALLCLTSEELGVYSKFHDNAEHLDFIVRAIIGCTYHITQAETLSDNKEAIKNAFIRILNSSLIDVDKLDYIIRDSFVTGYRNVEMDLPRLMSSFILERNERQRNIIWPVYKKSALSIIEHVFIARNNEVRWIQSHNVVIYETWLLQRAVWRILSEKLETPKDGKQVSNFFKPEAFSRIGNSFGGRLWRYLADEDILSLLKEYYDDIDEIREIIDRRTRKKAVWKTHADYVATFTDTTDDVFEFFNIFITDKENIETPPLSRNDIAAAISRIQPADRRYDRFFAQIGKNLAPDSPDYDMLFLGYAPNSWSKTFDADQIFIKYDTGCVTYREATKASAVTQQTNSSDERGFFIFYDANKGRISPKNFKEAYNSFVNINTGIAPN